MDNIVVGIYSIVGDALCVSAEDGEKVFDRLSDALQEGKKVTISFLNVEMLTSAFLNTAIGKLYGIFDEQKIKASLSVVDIKKEDRMLIKRVTDTAKLYYKYPQRMEKTIREILGEE
jgi:hypothetical protein